MPNPGLSISKNKFENFQPLSAHRVSNLDLSTLKVRNSICYCHEKRDGHEKWEIVHISRLEVCKKNYKVLEDYDNISQGSSYASHWKKSRSPSWHRRNPQVFKPLHFIHYRASLLTDGECDIFKNVKLRF